MKQVTSLLCFTKKVNLKGRQELVELGITEMRMKEGENRQWRLCMEVGLKIVDKDIKREQSAEEIVERWELLRDCWLQLAADGL